MTNQSGPEKNSLFHEIVDVVLDNLPVDIGPQFRNRIASIIERFFGPIFEEIQDRRLPRLALVGRTRSGKSSVINAFFEREVVKVGAVQSVTAKPELVTGAVQSGIGLPKWATVRDDHTDEMIEILDTRGVQEGFAPEGAPAITSVESVLAAIRQQVPDMFLFLQKATEVNAAVEGDLDAFAQCLRVSKSIYDGQEMYPLVIGIPTHCDQLDPPNFWSPAVRQFCSDYWESAEGDLPREESGTDHEYRLEKLDNIRLAVRIWTQQLLKIQEISQVRNLKVIPVTAYMRFRKDKTPDPNPDADLRWNIDELKNLILSELPSRAKMDFFRLARVRTEQHRYAHRIILATSAVCTTIGASPTPPGFDLPFLLAMQVLQIMLIAFISGRKLTWQTAAEFLAASGIQTGAGFVLREVFRGGAKLIPIAGWLVSGAIAGFTTGVSGKLAEAYFIEGKKITVDEAKRRAATLSSQQTQEGKLDSRPTEERK